MSPRKAATVKAVSAKAVSAKAVSAKAVAAKAATAKPVAKKVDVGLQAPAFKIKDATGKEIDLAELTAKGPVLVRLTCGCSGCDKELAYFQEIDAAYKKAGLTSVAIFKAPDAEVAKILSRIESMGFSKDSTQ